MKKFLKSIDSFSHEFRFTYKGQDKYKSVLGGISTVIAMIIILFNGFLMGKDIYLKQNPNIINFEELSDFHPTAKINYKDNFFAFSISDEKNTLFDYNTFLDIIPVITISYTDPKGNYIVHETFLELTDCYSEFVRLNLTLPASKDILININCIKNFYSVLSGSWTENHISYLTFKIFECSNKTKVPNSFLVNEDDKLYFDKFKKNLTNINKLDYNEEINENENKKFEDFINNNSNENKKNITQAICKSSKEIKEIIPNLSFNLIFDIMVLNNKDFNNPMTQKKNMDSYILGATLFRKLDYYFNYNVVRTDDGFIFSNKYKDKLKIDKYKHNIDYKGKNEGQLEVLFCNIFITNKIKLSTREYIKLQNIFANLGGIIKLVMMLFNMILREFYTKKMNVKIINKLFDFDEIQSDQSNNKDKDLIYINKNLSNNNENNFLNSNQERIEMNQTNIRINENSNNVSSIDCIEKSNSYSRKENYDLVESKEIQIQRIFYNKIDKNIISKKKLLMDRINRLKTTISPNKNINEILYQKPKKNNNNNGNEDVFNKIEKNNQPKLDSKLNEIISSKKKLRFTNFETVMNIFCKCFQRKEMELKTNLYNAAKENLIEYTDYLKTIEIQRSFIKLKYLLLNTQQIRSFQFMTNPKKFESKLHHDIESYALAFEIKYDKKNSLYEVINYFEKKIKYEEMNNVDLKIYEILCPRIKKVIMMKKEELIK